MTMNTQANLATNPQKGHILWLDYNEDLWANSYRQVMPETSDMLLVQDTAEAKLAFECYDDIHTAVLQLNSYKSFGSEPELHDFGPVPTSMLVQWLEQRNFRGRVFVISSMGLDNAIAYTDQKGRIRLEASGDESRAIIRIVDNGIGISKQDLPRVFERFDRINEAGVRGEAALGLGLPLTRQFLEAHGGTVDLESKKGKGTTVTLSIPRGTK